MKDSQNLYFQSLCYDKKPCNPADCCWSARPRLSTIIGKGAVPRCSLNRNGSKDQIKVKISVSRAFSCLFNDNVRKNCTHLMVAKENSEMSASELSPSNTPCYCGCDSLYSRSHSSRLFCNILIFPKIIHKLLSGELDLSLDSCRRSFPDSWAEQEKMFLS